jgi:hypothetical protein
MFWFSRKSSHAHVLAFAMVCEHVSSQADVTAVDGAARAPKQLARKSDSHVPMSGYRYVIAVEEHAAMRVQRALAMSVHAAVSFELAPFELHATLTATVTATRKEAERIMRA